MSALTHAQASLRAYAAPVNLAMLALGFSSGLPFLLTGATLGYWLREEGTSLTAIGFISWVGLAYSFKFLWAPLVDRTLPPLTGGLGRRRSWMLLTQIFVGAGLFAMAAWGPSRGLVALGVFALIVAFSSATQDIVIDAWRIESATTDEQLGLLTSAYQFGYRIALLATDALILISATYVGWAVSYAVCGAAMAIGIAATLMAPEPARGEAAIESILRKAPLESSRGIFDAIAGPFIAFFRAHGWLAVLMLTAIALYQLPYFVMGPMANPFYHDIGLSKVYVGGIRSTVGLVASFVGIAAAGAFVVRFGTLKALIAGGIVLALATAAFATLAIGKPDNFLFAAVMAGDSFSISFAGVALVSYLSSLTSLGYTATQYALLSSAYTWVGKFLKGFSGAFIDSLKVSHGLMGAYEIFFIAAGLVGIPAILLFVVLEAYHPKASAPAS
ncbi:MAG TPA: MFS transporter [Rhizomicrobium sp.]|nr:MFS transporter [Rhizomicrobium sp.]